MYLHCKKGFVEADRWDGDVPNDSTHAGILEELAMAGQEIVVCRSRRMDTLYSLCSKLPRFNAKGVLPRIEVLASPPSWDYEYRVYLLASEWGMVLTQVAMNLDYRNFKSYTGRSAPQENKLAHSIWHAAHDAAAPKTHAHTAPKTKGVWPSTAEPLGGWQGALPPDEEW